LSDSKHSKNRREFLATGGLAAAALATGLLHTRPAAATDAAAGEFAGKVGFVTGGARGIGLACARMFAQSGADVALYDIASSQIPGVGHTVASEQDLADAKSQIEKLGVRCLTLRGDVRSRPDLAKAMARVVSDFGSLDYLVVNAGVTQIGKLDEFTDEEVAAILDINLSGSIKTIQAATPIMREQKSGRIICISSILGRQGHRDWPVYSASKWGLIGFTKSAAHLLGKDGVTCNAICPGLVDTKLVNNQHVLKRWLPHSPTWETVNDWVRANSPIPRGAYQPDDIAAVVKMFCEPSTATVTGEVFDISMGASAEGTA